MLDGRVIAPFLDWLNEDTSEDGLSFAELGLRDDAPPEAVEAYKRYLELKERARKKGVKI